MGRSDIWIDAEIIWLRTETEEIYVLNIEFSERVQKDKLNLRR